MIVWKNNSYSNFLSCLGMFGHLLLLKLVFFFLVRSGWSSQMPGVVSPHELLQKLQLVQHEQREAPNDPPRPCPGLAPRFLGPTQGLAEFPAPILSTKTANEKAAVPIPVSSVNNVPFWFFSVLNCEDKRSNCYRVTMSLQVMSPPTIPATVAPNLLLSPNVFTQANTCTGLAGVATEHSLLFSKLSLQPEVPVLSRSQLQATLLSLIKVCVTVL